MTILHVSKLKLLLVFNHTENGGDKESAGNCFLFRTGEGKPPPFDNAEENQPRRVAEIFTVGAFMKINGSRFRSNLAYFSGNDCFSHFIQRIVYSKGRRYFRN